MRTRILAVLVILAVAVTATVVLAQGARRGAPAAPPAGGPGMAQPGGPGCMGMGLGFGPKMAQQLGLTQDQLTRLQAIKQDCAKATQPLREQMQTKMTEMKQLWMADQPNAAAIKAAAADMDALRAEVRNICIDYAIAGYNVLTPDQKAKLHTALQDMPGCGMMLGCGGCGGPGMMGKGAGMGPGAGMGMGAGCPMGQGTGPRDGTGPRAAAGTCPMMNK